MTSHEDFQSESVELCKTPEELVKSPLFIKALEKNLEPADVQYIQAILANRLANKELTIREKKYLDGLEQDEVLINQFNDIINTIEYISKKKGVQMADKQELPHFDDAGKADAKKVITWLRGGEIESKETISQLPLAVKKQEEDAIKYFKKNNEPKHLEVVKGIQKLRAEGKITYIDLGEGRYEVTMPCGSRKLKMYFPPDAGISDAENTYTNFADETITNKETTRGKLWSKEGVKHLEQQEKSHKKWRTKAEFLELGKSLCPDGNEEEQILAFMMATGFYGWMRLSDTDAKKKDYQLAVKCYHSSANRNFDSMSVGISYCSLVHSTFVG